MPSKKKKGPKSEKAQEIVKLRDSLISKGIDAEKVGLACKGMFKCDKLADAACLDKILSNLKAIEKKGGRARSKSPKKK